KNKKNKINKKSMKKKIKKDFKIIKQQDKKKEKKAINRLKKGMLTKGKHMGADENPPLTEGGLFNTLMSDDPLKGVSDNIAKTVEDNMEFLELSMKSKHLKNTNVDRIKDSKY